LNSCADLRASASYWRTLGGAAPISYAGQLNAVLPPACVSRAGLLLLQRALSAAASQLLLAPSGLNASAPMLRAVGLAELSALQLSRRRLAGGLAAASLRLTLVVGSGSSLAPAGWQDAVQMAGGAGGPQPAALARAVGAAVASLATDSQVDPGLQAQWAAAFASAGALTFSAAAPIAAPSGFETVEAAASAAASAAAGAAEAGAAKTSLTGAAAVAGAAVVALALLVRRLRTKGECMGHRMKPLSTLGGLIPLDKDVTVNATRRIVELRQRSRNKNKKAPIKAAAPMINGAPNAAYQAGAGPFVLRASLPQLDGAGGGAGGGVGGLGATAVTSPLMQPERNEALARAQSFGARAASAVAAGGSRANFAPVVHLDGGPGAPLWNARTY